MENQFEKNWTNYNNGYPLEDEEVKRYISVLPSENQCRLAQNPFYCFIHFGMNTATAREWGKGTETAFDFTIKSIEPEQWAKHIKAAGASGIILTCKHHDGFCLWPSAYTSFSVKNAGFSGDIVKMVSDACKAENLYFGVYLSPWDMHEETYGTEAYNDYFCNQLTELLTNYGEINEVWFDGAKGANARAFEYDWQRYYKLIRELQPKANIAICGPDVRWVGNEGGKTRKSEFSVVPKSLCMAETVSENSQHTAADAAKLRNLKSTDEDLGSRKVLAESEELCWYPAEVDVSIRKGWFWSKNENFTVKSGKRLFKLYLDSVGKNCTFLLNVPPTNQGVLHKRDVKSLTSLGKRIAQMTSKPIAVEQPGCLNQDNGCLDFNFDCEKKLKYVIIKEDIQKSQRVEAFDIYIKKKNGKYKKAASETIIGSCRIVALGGKRCVGARIVIRQSRSNPVISEIGFYA
ncbi:MAG: alpha-L-fucosidase [Eubacterium sp.]|nr:alpha-L-fucosidase [Eubacterium sp.]